MLRGPSHDVKTRGGSSPYDNCDALSRSRIYTIRQAMVRYGEECFVVFLEQYFFLGGSDLARWIPCPIVWHSIGYEL
jgi:hypothetical protein